jgi:hypothetical protein
MKYIKYFENFEDEDIEDFKVGDIVYCIDNSGYEIYIEIGVPYTVSQVNKKTRDYGFLWIIFFIILIKNFH